MTALQWDSRVMLFGGDTGATCAGDTWLWDGRAWRKMETSVSPSARCGAVFSRGQDTFAAWLFGGRDAQGNHLDDLWMWDGLRSRWAQVSRAPLWPPARSHAAAAWDNVAEALVVHGGQGALGGLQDTWRYRECCGWEELNWGGPLPGTASSMVWDAGGSRLVLLGTGDVGGVRQTALWSSQWGTWSPFRSFNAEITEGGTGMVYDESTHTVVVFGGMRGERGLSVAYEMVSLANHPLDQQVRPVSFPVPGRGFHGMAAATGGRILVFGGKSNGAQRGDAWVRSGGDESAPAGLLVVDLPRAFIPEAGVTRIRAGVSGCAGAEPSCGALVAGAWNAFRGSWQDLGVLEEQPWNAVVDRRGPEARQSLLLGDSRVVLTVMPENPHVHRAVRVDHLEVTLDYEHDGITGWP
jgi:hypothetical protein